MSDAPPTPRMIRRKDVVVIIAIAIVCLALWFCVCVGPTMIRRGSYRAVCKANLSGIGVALDHYANVHGGGWPIPPHAPAVATESGAVSYAPGKIGKNRERQTTAKDTEVSTTRVFYALMREHMATPAGFICLGSTDTYEGYEELWDFAHWDHCSYGFQVPFGKKGVPASDCDPRMPLAADKGPFSAALEHGQPNPGVPQRTYRDRAKYWRAWNSPNHEGEGQSVLFPDGHVEWMTRPCVGINGDNIYTRWASADAGIDANALQRIQGTPPTSNETPWSDTDTLIYP